MASKSGALASHRADTWQCWSLEVRSKRPDGFTEGTELEFILQEVQLDFARAMQLGLRSK